MHVALFTTCLIDQFRPNAGFATVSLLEKAGCTVEVPPEQTCCGQPAYNNGDIDNARIIARQVINLLEKYEYIVVPSASCAGMIKLHYPELFENNPIWYKKAMNLSGRCYELITFLHDILKVNSFPLTSKHSITYHDSCSSLREIKAQQKTRTLLACSEKINLLELKNPEVCCGFGGTFCVKYPDISQYMVDDKVADIESTNADLLVSGDLGCLLNIAGRLKRLNKPVRVYHVAELLAGMTDVAGIGDSESQNNSKIEKTSAVKQK